MLYQLPSGKVIYLSVEEFLSMGDREFHELTNGGFGEEPSYAMYYGKQRKDPIIKDEVIEEIPLDYVPDIEETDLRDPIDFNNLPE
jgi:hypothetical protein